MNYLTQNPIYLFSAFCIFFWSTFAYFNKKYPHKFLWVGSLADIDFIYRSPLLFLKILTEYKSYSLVQFFSDKNDSFFFLNRIAFPLIRKSNRKGESKLFQLHKFSHIFKVWNNLLNHLNTIQGIENFDQNKFLIDCLRKNSSKVYDLSIDEFNLLILEDEDQGLLKKIKSRILDLDLDNFKEDFLINLLRKLELDILECNLKYDSEKKMADFFQLLKEKLEERISLKKTKDLEKVKTIKKDKKESQIEIEPFTYFINSHKLEQSSKIIEKLSELCKSKNNPELFIFISLLIQGGYLNENWKKIFNSNLSKEINYLNATFKSNLVYKSFNAVRKRNNVDISTNPLFLKVEKYFNSLN